MIVVVFELELNFRDCPQDFLPVRSLTDRVIYFLFATANFENLIFNLNNRTSRLIRAKDPVDLEK